MNLPQMVVFSKIWLTFLDRTKHRTRTEKWDKLFDLFYHMFSLMIT